MSTRPQLTTEQVEDAMAALHTRLYDTLNQKGWGSFASKHEALGAIVEEMRELEEAVRVRPALGGNSKVRHELLDLAIAAVFAVACLDAKTMDW